MDSNTAITVLNRIISTTPRFVQVNMLIDRIKVNQRELYGSTVHPAGHGIQTDLLPGLIIKKKYCSAPNKTFPVLMQRTSM
jgi:hypothetical protein